MNYLISVRNYSFPKAVETILGRAAVQPPIIYAPVSKPVRHLELPEKNFRNDAVVKYLMNRGIDREIIDYCIHNQMLYESAPYHNCVFVGLDRNGNARYAALRGTVGDFKGEASGSDKHFSFLLADTVDAVSVHVFECAIDAMSYATLLKMTGRDWKHSPLLSLAGVYKSKRGYTIPMAMDHFLAEHPNVKTLLLHLDNDEIGRGASEGIIERLGSKYEIINSPPPDVKDVNEYLVQRINNQRRKEDQER